MSQSCPSVHNILSLSAMQGCSLVCLFFSFLSISIFTFFLRTDINSSMFEVCPQIFIYAYEILCCLYISSFIYMNAIPQMWFSFNFFNTVFLISVHSDSICYVVFHCIYLPYFTYLVQQWWYLYWEFPIALNHIKINILKTILPLYIRLIQRTKADLISLNKTDGVCKISVPIYTLYSTI